MKITRIHVYGQDQPFRDREYRCRNRTEYGFNSTLVAIETVADIGGADIDTAAMEHLSLSTPERYRPHSCDFHNWVTVSNATGLTPIVDGHMAAPRAPGLGVAVLEETLGVPIFTLGR